MGSARIAIHLALMFPRYSFTAWPAAYSEQMDIGMASEGNKKNEDTDGKTSNRRLVRLSPIIILFSE
jgi:hypothetical protein